MTVPPVHALDGLGVHERRQRIDLPGQFVDGAQPGQQVNSGRLLCIFTRIIR